MRKADQMLLEWYDANKRSLPWRGTRDPYRIWLSEIMLQQTRVETVKGYYLRFLERYPDVHALARAESDELLKMWEGLGYYSRARNLHKAAKLVSKAGGAFPGDVKGLEKLPGIGPYVARAVASIAWDIPVPALDGNQMRVLSRLLGISRVLKTPFDIEDEAMEALSFSRPGDYNQALMDLGSAVCTPKKPDCDACPLKSICCAYVEGDPEFYPQRPAPVVKKEEERTVCIIECPGGIAIRRRPEGGLLGGLYEFPSFEGYLDENEASAALSEAGFKNIRDVRRLPDAKHVFTHLIWKMRGLYLRADAAPEGFIIVDSAAFAARAFPTALRKYHEIAGDLLHSIESGNDL